MGVRDPVCTLRRLCGLLSLVLHFFGALTQIKLATCIENIEVETS